LRNWNLPDKLNIKIFKHQIENTTKEIIKTAFGNISSGMALIMKIGDIDNIAINGVE
jgi:hypothetical protein